MSSRGNNLHMHHLQTGETCTTSHQSASLWWTGKGNRTPSMPWGEQVSLRFSVPCSMPTGSQRVSLPAGPTAQR
jgi:hypothetical protein